MDKHRWQVKWKIILKTLYQYCIPIDIDAYHYHSTAIFSFSFFSAWRTFLFSHVHTGRVNGFQISNTSDRRQSRPAGVRCTRMVSLLACCRKSRYRLWAFRIAVTQATIHAWFLITWCAQDIPMARRILVRWALSQCSI